LFGASTCSRSLFGVLETPLPKTYNHRLTIGGWAISPNVRRTCAVTQMFKSMLPTRQETFGLPTTAGSAGSDFFDSIRRRRKRIDA
jgi:hypothetical protein